MSLAERIRTLGGKAPGLPDEVVKNKTIDEPSDAGKDPEAMIGNMCIVHEEFLQNLRPTIDKTEKLRDMGTNDMLVSDVLRLHEMQLWFMRSSLD